MNSAISDSAETPIVATTWSKTAARAVLVLAGFSALYCWCHAMSIYVAFGRRWPTIWPWVFEELASLAILVALSAWYVRRHGTATRPVRFAIVAGILWTISASALWLVVGSPFARDAGVALGYSVTSWWILWAWLMFFIPWRWPLKLALLAPLVAAIPGFNHAVRVEGLDGDAKPKIVWRDELRLFHATPAELVADADRSAELSSDNGSEFAGVYPRFRGADELATVSGANLARDWSQTPPTLVWRRGVGLGWSAFAVAGNMAVTQEQQGAEECVVSYDRGNGRIRWVHRDQAHYQFPGTGDGPRATPTIDEQRVYALGATGVLNCLDRATGRLHWTTNILSDSEAKPEMHGMCGSPLIVGEFVVVSAGGTNASLVAYDKASGQRGWRAGSDRASYASPQLVELDGVPQVLVVNKDSLNAHDPRTGELLWTTEWSNPQHTNCSQPFPIARNRVFISSDYGSGCAVVEAILGSDSKWQASKIWTSRAMQTKFSSVVVRDGYAFGLDDGILECVSLADGKRKWKKGRYGHGQLLLADDLLLIVAEDGRVALVEASGDAYRELASIQALEGKTWNNPALAGRQLFVRNDREAACYELPVIVGATGSR